MKAIRIESIRVFKYCGNRLIIAPVSYNKSQNLYNHDVFTDIQYTLTRKSVPAGNELPNNSGVCQTFSNIYYHQQDTGGVFH